MRKEQFRAKVLIIYYSKTGNTAVMATAAEAGVQKGAWKS